MIRQATPDDASALNAIAKAIGLFQPHELEEMDGMIAEYFNGNLGDSHTWIVSGDTPTMGAAYYAPEAFCDDGGTWNLYFIGVDPTAQGQGIGSALLTYIEQRLTQCGARLLLVETSGVESFEQTRKFYRKSGFAEEARIRDFYKPGDDKIIFRKVLTP
ncbi:MAG: GNAT family N-acetyltransferase [Cyanobacteria bacterium J06632_3]